jgi:hypothetical protein
MKAIVPEQLYTKLKELFAEDTLKDLIIVNDGERLVYWIARAGRPLGRKPLPISSQAVRELRKERLSWRQVARRLRCDWRTARDRAEQNHEKHCDDTKD